MVYGSKQNGEATLELSAKEHEFFKAGKVVKKRTGCASGEYDIIIQLKFIKPLPIAERASDTCSCGRKIKTFMHGCDERSDLVETKGCPFCDDRCEMCGI